ncbi:MULTISPECIES: bifunctional glutamate N-acetyltransferase/amino-acid acetyltransferase ArgJ [Enterococcus]|uniref:bifunctional glutamate N-acetyltransferase/amino-acid acetyltransferase ArgJ n=1 Tax=Enterococcus TaxID=1350 RepID=UPI00065DF95C|nr:MULTISPECIES: bifunctional glutamate N-acetyltransferase/amino-acid acetyltransferase ArgJ [Enterococcus]
MEQRLPKGFFAGGVSGGLKENKCDIGFIYSQNVCQAAGLFTNNQFPAAPVALSRKVLQAGKLQGILVNSGGANAITGERGVQDAKKMQQLFAQKADLSQDLVAIASTGKIGEFLPMEKIKRAVSKIDLKEQNLIAFQEAIATTDTQEKIISREFLLDKTTIRLTGIAKGAGMVHPKLATVLVFLLTDADLTSEQLQRLLKKAADNSLNQLTIDGESSTNDSCFLLANGASRKKVQLDSKAEADFAEGLEQLLIDLTKKIARDGEGATKLLEVRVVGAETVRAARKISKRIAQSMLVKTAMFGEDPNWGRILSAIGDSNDRLDITTIDVAVCWETVLQQGIPAAFNEAELLEKLKQEEILIEVNLHGGREQATAWGCDLSEKYVEINAAYRT